MDVEISKTLTLTAASVTSKGKLLMMILIASDPGRAAGGAAAFGAAFPPYRALALPAPEAGAAPPARGPAARDRPPLAPPRRPVLGLEAMICKSASARVRFVVM